jgi:hypothetical protein
MPSLCYEQAARPVSVILGGEFRDALVENRSPGIPLAHW